MKNLAIILACTLSSVLAFPKPQGMVDGGHGGFGYVVSTSTPNLANCKVIRSSDYNGGHEDKCETVRVYELCIPTRSQVCLLSGISLAFTIQYKSDFMVNVGPGKS